MKCRPCEANRQLYDVRRRHAVTTYAVEVDPRNANSVLAIVLVALGLLLWLARLSSGALNWMVWALVGYWAVYVCAPAFKIAGLKWLRQSWKNR